MLYDCHSLLIFYSILDYLEQALTHTHTYILIHTLSQILSLTWASFSVERERERERKNHLDEQLSILEGLFCDPSLSLPLSHTHSYTSLSLSHTPRRD